MVDQDLGLSGALKVAHLAEIHGLKVVPHLATEILAHLIAARPNGLTVEYYPWAVPLFVEVPPVDHGELVLSDRPGVRTGVGRRRAAPLRLRGRLKCSVSAREIH